MQGAYSNHLWKFLDLIYKSKIPSMGNDLSVLVHSSIKVSNFVCSSRWWLEILNTSLLQQVFTYEAPSQFKLPSIPENVSSLFLRLKGWIISLKTKSYLFAAEFDWVLQRCRQSQHDGYICVNVVRTSNYIHIKEIIKTECLRAVCQCTVVSNELAAYFHSCIALPFNWLLIGAHAIFDRASTFVNQGMLTNNVYIKNKFHAFRSRFIERRKCIICIDAVICSTIVQVSHIHSIVEMSTVNLVRKVDNLQQ